MKDKLLAVFVRFVKNTFSEERLLHLIADLLDVLYDRNQKSVSENVKEVLDYEFRDSV